MGCVEINRCVGCTRQFFTSHFSAMTWPSWLGRAVRNWHRHAIEQASRRWRGDRRNDSARTRRKILISTQVMGFGSDAQGQLGGARIDESDSDSSDTDSTSSSSTTSADEVWTPARVPGLCGKGVVALAAGGAANSDAGHTVAVTAAGAVLCLGAGGLGQLGAGVDSSSTPMPVPVRKTAWS